MNPEQKISLEESVKIVPRSQSNPITHRKTANRLYGGYNNRQKFYGTTSVDSLEIFYEFCAMAKSKDSVGEVFSCLNSIVTEKLGYNFTAIGLVNDQSNYLNIKLIDRIGNTYSSRIQLSETKNPIIECFIKKTQKNINSIDFLNTSYLHNSYGIIIPLMVQDDCVGVLVAGSETVNPQNDDILKVLSDYLALLVINKKLGERVNEDISTDRLTGLKNHRGYQEALFSEIKKAESQGKPVSIIMFDVNNISQINREYGHAKGDEIICIVAEKIRQNMRSIDIAGRYGGDEISVILPDLDNAQACYIAEYLNYSISCCLVDDIGSIKVSIGVATYPTCSKDQEKLLILAEQAMYISKSKGYKNGMSTIVSSQDIDFWNEMALNSFAAVIAKRHSQWGINFEEEIVRQFHNDSLTSNGHLIDVVTSLAGAIDAKDPYTRGHSQSVSRYAEALARTVNLPEAEVERIKLGALLHDVGKIGIPEAVLGKPGSLSEPEWEIMKKHPTIGVKKVLEPIESLRDLIPMVLHHHERWDGGGYPDGLKGDKIPYAARIVSIADAFHSLISDRPYRKGMSLDKAIDILRVGAGIQWDKNLVRKFIIIAPSLCTKV